MYSFVINKQLYEFENLKTLLAKASPIRSGDQLAGIAATSLTEMVAAQSALAELPLKEFLTHYLIPPQEDEVTRLIISQHDTKSFALISHLTVGGLRNFLLSYECDTEFLTSIQYGLTPEMVAAVSKIMSNQDLIAVAKKCRVITQFRNTIGLSGRFSTRLQPNDACDNIEGIMSGVVDGLMYGCGDAVIGINPSSDHLEKIQTILTSLDNLRKKLNAPIQTCVLTHISNSILLAKKGVPIDLFFQSIGGTEAVNKSFGINLDLLKEAYELGLSLNRGTIGKNMMYFETGQGSALSANAHHGIDQQTIEVRSYAVARAFSPLLVNTVVGFIGPEYLLDGKQITRAALEDHFCGKLLGLPMGCDVCYTNHSHADQNDMDNLLLLLAEAGCNFVMAIPGADDVMLNYQSTSYQDSIHVRNMTKLRPSPEFESWLEKMAVFKDNVPRRDLSSAVTQTFFQPQLGQYFNFSQSSPARLGMGHVGGYLTTKDRLRFQADYALAKDAVYSEFAKDKIISLCQDLKLNPFYLESQANDIHTFLLRPDLGRLLSIDSQRILKDQPQLNHDLLIVVSGGLSPVAIEHQLPNFLPTFIEQADLHQWSLAPIMIVPRGRVALGDQINSFFKAKMLIMLIGERPGLSSPDSMGIYFTLHAKPGCTDAERNCISNIHQKGLSGEEAARHLAYLINKAFSLGMTGVNLKDDYMEKGFKASSDSKGVVLPTPTL